MRLVTIPHTGSQFAISLLPTVTDFAHITEDVGGWFCGPVVVTLRDPARVAISCVNRGERVNVGLFNRLPDLESPNVHFLCVDGDPVVERERLSEFVGEPITAPWCPTGSQPDAWGLKDSGLFPFAHRINQPTRRFLKRYGYSMPWLEA